MNTFKTFLMCALCVFFANFTISCDPNFNELLSEMNDLPESSIQRVLVNVLEDQNILFKHSLENKSGAPEFKNNEINGSKWYYFIEKIEALLKEFNTAFTVARDPADSKAELKVENTRGDGFSTCVFSFTDSNNLVKSYLLPHSVLSNSIQGHIKDATQGYIKEATNEIHVVMPNSLRNVPNHFFEDNTNILSFTALGLADVGRFSFANCYGLKEVIFDALTSIRKSAFSGCIRLTSISLSDLLEFVEVDAFKDAPIKTLNIVSEIVAGNEINRVCEALLGSQNDVDTGFPAGQITTFKFSLSKKISTDLIAYINGVLSLNKANIDLLSGVESGTLDLTDAEISEISNIPATFANSHGSLIDTIKHGNKTYKWNSGWILV